MENNNIKPIINDPEDNPEIIDKTASSIVSEILKKYGLKYFDDTFLEKLEKGGPIIMYGEIINDCAKKISLSLFSDKEATNFLETKLTLKGEEIKLLLEDIKTKIVPIIKRANKNKFNNIDASASIKKEDHLPIMPIQEKIIDNSAPIKKERPKRILETNKKLELATKQINKSDTYREPIE